MQVNAIDPATSALLIDRIWPAPAAPLSTPKWLRRAALVVAGNILLVAASKVAMPFGPVPYTLQTLAVLLIGITYGPRLGSTTLAAFLAQGAVGIPVFAGPTAGIAAFAGPTGGYLVGFLCAAAALGFLAERGWGRTVFTTLTAMLVGEAILFGLGVSWLAAHIGIDNALSAGLVIFLPWEAVKIAMAMALLPGMWKLVGHVRRD